MHTPLSSVPLLGARLLLAAAVACLTTSLANAQEEAKAKVKKEGWETGLNAALSLARGNSKNLLLNGGLLSEYHRGRNEFRLEIAGNYGESETKDSGSSNLTEQTTLQNATGTADYKRLLNEREYAYANGEIMHDHIAGIDYRALIGPGVGRYFLKSDRQVLSADAGLAYVRKVMTDQDAEDTLNLRVAQRYEIQLLAKSKLWESVEFSPAFEDFDNYFVNFEIGAESAMTDLINLRLVFTDQYNNQPAPDKKKNDLQLLGGLGVKI